MKVTLNIENDAELRAYIKDCINGQVLAIVREDFRDVVRTEIERKLKATGAQSFDYMYKDATKSVIQDILYREHNVSTWGDTFIKTYVNLRLDSVLQNKDWSVLVDNLAKEKVKSLIK